MCCPLVCSKFLLHFTMLSTPPNLHLGYFYFVFFVIFQRGFVKNSLVCLKVSSYLNDNLVIEICSKIHFPVNFVYTFFTYFLSSFSFQHCQWKVLDSVFWWDSVCLMLCGMFFHFLTLLEAAYVMGFLGVHSSFSGTRFSRLWRCYLFVHLCFSYS